MLKFISTILLIAITIIACNKDTIYESTSTINNSTWTEKQSILFEWNNFDTLQKYDLIINLSHTDKIPNQNIYIKCKSTSPDLKSNEQIVSLELLATNGTPYGNCQFGTCSLKMILASNIYFPILGKYSLSISPFSRIDSIPGIKEIGLSIEKSKFKK